MERIKSFNDVTSRQAVIASLIMKVLQMASIGPREAIPVLYLVADEAIQIGVRDGHITAETAEAFQSPVSNPTFGTLTEDGVKLSDHYNKLMN